MHRVFLSICCVCVSVLSFGQAGNNFKIIPEPAIAVSRPGIFLLPKHIYIEAKFTPEIMPVVDYLRSKLSMSTGAAVYLKSTAATPPTIRFVLNTIRESTIGKEGYHLSVGRKTIVIRANEPAGLFYGVQTLIQMFPKEIESKAVVANFKFTVPCAEITDYPRFAWRGLMLDVSRHFFTKDEVKQYIDQMVRFKFNILHMHLTDDEGWRVEIKSLPRLTTVGAYNVKKTGQFGTFTVPTPDEPRTYGGYYTQDDIKELVAYGKKNFLNIMPEIDVPGHSLAAVVSYPSLSCTPGADKYQVRSGETLKQDNTLNPASENTYLFLDKVVTEVSQLFPFGYMHMGGDECDKEWWAKSDSVTALMKRENLKTYEEVQSYFEKRLEKIVESKGKKFMGWDEILEGGLGPDAAVMSWRGVQGGISAAKMGHEVVMSPTTFAYLDYMQSDRVNEPHVYATLRLNKTYSFNPVPDSVDAKLILGGQANLWTEQVFNFRQVDYMTWPRGFAIAEDVWSPLAKKNWATFFPKVEKEFARFDEADIKYAPSVYDPSFNEKLGTDNKLQVILTNEVPGLDIYYSFDNSFPDNFYPKYTGPVTVPEDATQMRVITYRRNKPIGRMITMPIAELKSRLGR